MLVFSLSLLWDQRTDVFQLRLLKNPMHSVHSPGRPTTWTCTPPPRLLRKKKDNADSAENMPERQHDKEHTKGTIWKVTIL